MLVVSGITWFVSVRPPELQSHWESEYPEIDVASAKIAILKRHGWSPAGCFILPERCWLENYYRLMQGRFEAFLERHGRSVQARALVEAERHEISLYKRYLDCFNYGFYAAGKCRY